MVLSFKMYESQKSIFNSDRKVQLLKAIKAINSTLQKLHF